uniref:transglutaminase family protein n=1 Tax=Pseudomaricurvus sp. TaxID=2004510 RepID=UPI003F6ABF1E
MTIRVALNHNTYYQFDRPINLSPHTIRLRPAPHSRTPIHSYSLKVEPENHFINWQQDAFGNFLARLVFPEKTTKFSVEVEVQADMTVINPFDFFLDDYAEEFPFTYPRQLKKELKPYLEKGKHGPLFRKLLKSIPLEKRRTNDFLVELNQKVEQIIEYAIRMEPGVQTPEETLQLGIGSCRDSAWLLVQLFRHVGLAARFASGYLVQLKPDEKSLDGPSGAAQDFTDLHAWCEVYLPGAGWIGLDPTSGLFASEGHIPLACTPDPVSAAPIEGFTDKCEVEFEHSNEVSRILEDPRVTKPYTDNQWAEALSLGDKVDKELEELDVRLTMGGEPTFVSIDDMESEQWNTAALGAHKLSLANSLQLKLRDHFAPNGLLHYGQGKWYPGEEVPRWALGIFWRKDGEPLWKNPKLLARKDKDYGYDICDAKKLMCGISKLLDIKKDYVQPVYEDALHYLLQERKLPTNIDNAIAKAKSSTERARLASILERTLKKPTGYIVPLEWDSIANNWQTCLWETRRDRLTLIPGDSPVGLRLPLDDLPYSAKTELPPQRDPFEPRQPLQKRAEMTFPASPVVVAQVQSELDDESDTDKNKDKTSKKTDPLLRSVIRTTLCVEARDGRLYVFMPPVYSLENYVEIIAAIEET